MRTASLRLFTVYGPRQRPDMAFQRLVTAGVRQENFGVFGDGEQTRDFTYVGDVVRAFRDAALSPFVGVANIGGGARTSMTRVLQIVESLTHPLDIVTLPAQRGDVRHTAADTTKAATLFGYQPRVSLQEGLELMVDAAKADAETALVSATVH
jgi:nucleoside-diphosphate-sugar epimerase